MSIWRTMSLVVLLVALDSDTGASQKGGKGPKITDKSFRQISSTFMDEPLDKSNRDWARLIMLYALDAPNAALVLSGEELHWTGVDNNDPQALLLLAAYTAGNIQSQLNSGVKRNDRYSGLITLFRVYRALRDRDDKYKVAAVDELLTMHEEDRLVRHLQKLDEKKPEKRTPAEEATIRRLMRTR
jgi:hypothetical protein